MTVPGGFRCSLTIDDAWYRRRRLGRALPESRRRGRGRDSLDIQTGLSTEHLGTKSRTTLANIVVEGGLAPLARAEGGMPMRFVMFYLHVRSVERLDG